MSNAPSTYGGVKPIRTDAMTNRIRITLQAMTAVVEQVNRDNGWFDAERSVGDGLALMHSEISEAFDAWRKNGFADMTPAGMFALAKPEGYGSELGDVLIRLLDQASRDGVDLAGEFTRKIDYNRTRGYRHGGRAV